jgi:hypothetical protein
MLTKDGREIKPSVRRVVNTIIELGGPISVRIETRTVGTPMVDICFDQGPHFTDQAACVSIDLALVPDLYEALGAMLRTCTNYVETLPAESPIGAIS